MSDKLIPTTRIDGYHAHVYYDAGGPPGRRETGQSYRRPIPGRVRPL